MVGTTVASIKVLQEYKHEQRLGDQKSKQINLLSLEYRSEPGFSQFSLKTVECATNAEYITKKRTVVPS